MAASRKIALHLLFVGSAVLPSHYAWVQNPVSISSVAGCTGAPSSVSSFTMFMIRSDGSDKNIYEDDEQKEEWPQNNDDSNLASNGDQQHSEVNFDDADGISKRMRLAKAQSEIDRILNNPVDPPFDFEAEMKKVVSISPPLVAEGSSEHDFELQVSQIEQDLYTAVKAQDFITAAKKQSEISQLHVDDCGMILQVNSAYYKAFSNKDVAEMERIWLKDRSCICIHPSFKPISGVGDIMHAWKRMFESSVGSFQRTWIDPCDIQLTVKATTAVVTCEELVYARRFVRGKKRESELVNKLTATNIFRKVGGRWYMTYHHSSWHADSEAAKLALQRGTRRSVKQNPAKDDLSKSASYRRRQRSPKEDDDEHSGPTGLESILGLGNAGPLLGDSTAGKEGASSKKITLGDMMMNLLNTNGGNDDSNNEDDSGIGHTGAIIHFSRIESDDDDDGGSDDDDDDDDDDDSTWEESNSRLQSFRKDIRSQRRNKMTFMKRQSESTDPLRQECIDSLRKLANEGRISPKQKRVLLTDIISCSSQGKESMVEVAYELLCGEGKDPEQAEEEFVDQCLVIAQSLSETKY
jgi:hypothetical protein